MFKVILAAVDESPAAVVVAGVASQLAEHFDGTVHLVRFIRFPQEFPPAAATQPDDLNEELVARARADLQRLAHGHPRIIVEEPIVSPFEPWRAITEEALRMNADLIVIGSHRYGGWDRVLRTNSGQVADRAPCHVFVVHSAPD